jgi:inosine-uridine nucleoside N-ribohydrolase
MMKVDDTSLSPIFLDCDWADDDQKAVLALTTAGRRLRLITGVGNGLAHGKQGAENMVALLKYINYPEIPVAYSEHPPLAGKVSFPEGWREGADKLCPMPLEETGRKAPGNNAVELLISHLNKTAEKITLLCTGPLTNIALVIQKEPELVKDKINSIFIMGGAVDVEEGNAQAVGNQYAEWNILVDPKAADIVFRSGVPIKLVPLDATNQVRVEKSFLKELRQKPKTNRVNWAIKVLENVKSFIKKGNYFFWDPFAAMCVLEKNLAKFKEAKVEVICKEGPEFGRIVRSNTGSEISFAYEVDREKFEQLFLNALNKE